MIRDPKHLLPELLNLQVRLSLKSKSSTSMHILPPVSDGLKTMIRKYVDDSG